MVRGPGHCWVWMVPRKNPQSAQKPTNVQDPVPRPAPPPALQLLVLRVLQTPVMKHHTDDALGAGVRGGGWRGGEQLSVGPRGTRKEPALPFPQSDKPLFLRGPLPGAFPPSSSCHPSLLGTPTIRTTARTARDALLSRGCYVLRTHGSFTNLLCR